MSQGQSRTISFLDQKEHGFSHWMIIGSSWCLFGLRASRWYTGHSINVICKTSSPRNLMDKCPSPVFIIQLYFYQTEIWVPGISMCMSGCDPGLECRLVVTEEFRATRSSCHTILFIKWFILNGLSASVHCVIIMMHGLPRCESLFDLVPHKCYWNQNC